MTSMVRFFLAVATVFCLTIPCVYADQMDVDMPKLVIDLSPVASGIYLQQMQIWLALALAGVALALLLFMIWNRQAKTDKANQGDVLARQVSLAWLVFWVLLIAGFAMPVLRFVLAAFPVVIGA